MTQQPAPPQRPGPQPGQVPPPTKPHGYHPHAPPGHPPYGNPPPAPAVKAPLPPGVDPHRGITVLVLGAIGIMSFIPFFGAAAWIMGSTDLNKMAAGRMDPEGFFFTRVGRICGIISTVLGALWLAAFVTFFIFPFVMMLFTSA